jgi:hypothetical protein
MPEGIYHNRKENFNLDNVVNFIIEDTRNQFFGFEIIEKQKTSIEEIKDVWVPRAVSKGELITLEEYISRYDNKHIEEISKKIEELRPNIFKEYDELIEGLKDPKLDESKFPASIWEREIRSVHLLLCPNINMF